jgi:hypothetical protein
MEVQGTVTATASDVMASAEAPQEVVAEATQETAPVEAAAEEEKPVEDEAFSRKFAALSKRERELQKREEEIKAKVAGYSSVDEYKKLAKTNVNKWLEESGVTFDEITEYYLNGAENKDPKIIEVEEKLSNLEKQIREKEEKAAEADRKAAVAGYKAEQKAHVLSKSAEYELIAATNSFDLVYDVTKEYYDKNNKVLSHDEAAKLVEDYLEREVDKVLKASKIKNKFSAQAQSKTETSQKTDSAKEQIKTLNNSMTSASGSPSSKPLTREESLERAASLLKFT